MSESRRVTKERRRGKRESSVEERIGKRCTYPRSHHLPSGSRRAGVMKERRERKEDGGESKGEQDARFKPSMTSGIFNFLRPSSTSWK